MNKKCLIKSAIEWQRGFNDYVVSVNVRARKGLEISALLLEPANLLAHFDSVSFIRIVGSLITSS